MKVSRNEKCPCGSGIKYKHCCLGIFNWESVTTISDLYRNLSVRGRNSVFLNFLYSILEIESLEQINWADVKKRITPNVVKKIYEKIIEIWPPDIDYQSAVTSRKKRELAFFSGDYRPERLIRVISKHIVYADVIALADPFVYPYSLKDEYNPLIHPEKFITSTAKNLHIWLHLAPLIDEGLVEIVRLPSDFDPTLNLKNMIRSRDLAEKSPTISVALDTEVRRRVDSDNHDMREWVMLANSDEKLASIFREVSQGQYHEGNVQDFLKTIRRMRDNHPYFTGVREELLYETTGSNVYDSIQVATFTDSYMLTDINVIWMQMHEATKLEGTLIDERARTAFSFDKISLPFIDGLDVEFALRLRKDGKLQSIRSLLNRVMRSAKSDTPLSEVEAKDFQDDLQERILEARDEFKKIDEQLIQWSGGQLVGSGALFAMSGVSLTISLSLLASANTISLINNRMQKSRIVERYPAALLMDLKAK